jgi:hypothetical protein
MDIVVRDIAAQGLIVERPMLVIMPLREIKVNKVDYSPMVGQMLGVGKEI